ncbi:hypothetical protein ACNI3K_03060 [Demequina sp. SO4-13]|uniref:hypothetical protein n=1 Tax=Demequina sp. SO4-13 TaxID=3401027 RepID=UPI003AF7B995
MDELENMLRREQESVRASLPHHGPEIYAQVRRGARRRRRVRALATGATAVLAVGAIGMGAWGIAGSNRAADLQPAVSESPSAVPTPTASATAEPSQEPVTGPALDDSADGIPDDGYPELAEPRHQVEGTDFGITYPQARVMEDWVWDRVGPDWGVGIASALVYPPTGDEVPPAVVYLHSPDEVYFEIGELPEAAWNDARVVSWQEDDRTARVWSTDGGGLYDMRTGTYDPVEFSIDGDVAESETFVMSNSGGDELWFAENDNGGGYYRWTDLDGWEQASLWDDTPDARHFGDSAGYSAPLTRADGDSVLLAVAPSVDAVPSSLVEYRLFDDATTEFDPQFPSDAVGVIAAGWLDDASVALEVEMPDGYRSAVVEAGGQVFFGTYGGLAEDQLEELPEWVDVMFGEPTRRDTAGVACGC